MFNNKTSPSHHKTILEADFFNVDGKYLFCVALLVWKRRFYIFPAKRERSPWHIWMIKDIRFWSVNLHFKPMFKKRILWTFKVIIIINILHEKYVH